MRIATGLLVALVISMWALCSPALAWKTSIVTKVDGEFYVVKASPYNHYLAAWVENEKAEYTLTVFSADSGKNYKVTTAAEPGGFCWIPRQNQLFYCKPMFVEEMQTYRVVYYIYDVTTRESTKLTEVPDVLETHKLDPIAADDGSTVFHLTIGVGNMPSFNVYHPEDGVLVPQPAQAMPDTNYDLSNDGSTVYWPLSDEDGNLYFVRWDLGTNTEAGYCMFRHDSFIADGGGLLKADAANQRIATLAWSEEQPRLQLYIFGWNNNNALRPVPVFLESGEEIIHYDWLGITGKIYAVIFNEYTKAFSIIELDPYTGIREEMLVGTDEIAFVDYAAGKDEFFYAVINRKGNKSQTYVIRLEE